MRRAIWLAVLVAAGGCAGEDPISPDVPDPACGDATPLVTWETFAEAFLSTHCQGCHASASLNRQGAPAGVRFDDEMETVALGNTILNVVSVTEPSMPPSGGPSDDDRQLLNVWLSCWAQ